MANGLELKRKKARAIIAAELTAMASFLLREGIVSEASAMFQAADRCQRVPTFADRWDYSIEGLSFSASSLRHLQPSNAAPVTIMLDITVVGLCVAEPEVDPLASAAIRILLAGASRNRAARASWHFDREEVIQTASGEIHPRYHVQYGGVSMRGTGDWGDALLCDVPRLVHPPMDAVLAVDFVISSFLPEISAIAREKDEYRAIVASAQCRLWKPYVASLATKWGTVSTHELAVAYWPTFI